MCNYLKFCTVTLLTVGLIAEAAGRRGSYGNRRPSSRFPASRPTLANQVSASSGSNTAGTAPNANGALDPNGEGINGQKRFVAQIVSGMLGGMAEQAVFVCPQMCENVLTTLNGVNPTIVGIFRGFLRCPNACQILDSVVQVGLGISDAVVEG